MPHGRCTLGLTPQKVKTVIVKNRYYWLILIQILREVYIWLIYKVFKAWSLRICYVKKVKILEIFRKTLKLPHKTLFFVVLFQNLIPKIRNPTSRFFPDFPDPVFSQKKKLGEVKLLAIFWPLHKYYVLCINWNWGMMGQMWKMRKTTFM